MPTRDVFISFRTVLVSEESASLIAAMTNGAGKALGTSVVLMSASPALVATLGEARKRTFIEFLERAHPEIRCIPSSVVYDRRMKG